MSLTTEPPKEPGRPVEAEAASTELPVILGRNLRRLRTRQGHSLERLAKLSGVSRAMLSQIETGKSAPTISLLWKIATALGIPFATLLDSQKVRGTAVLRREDAKVLGSSDGNTSRTVADRFTDTGACSPSEFPSLISPCSTQKSAPDPDL